MSAHKIFLSHTSRLARLPADRSFVQAALDTLAAVDLLARDMRFFTADDRTPAQLCIDTVRQCDVYVGLFGLDYGSPVRDRPDISYTELEFLTALEEMRARGMRVFVFLLDDHAEGHGPCDPPQAAFRQRVRDSGIVTAAFDTPGDLQYKLHRALEKLAPAAPHEPPRHPSSRPMLHVNLGHQFSPGDAAYVEFRLLCPGYETAPALRARLSAALDVDHWEPSPLPAREGPGRWSFAQSFVLTRGGNPCPPGRYEIRIEMEFPAAPAGGPGRFLWARLPFRVVGSKESAGRQLEIDLDELAVLDASAIDFSSFGKVVMRGRGRAQAGADGLSAVAPGADRRAPSGQGRCFQIPLRPNLDRAAELPFASAIVQRRAAGHKIMVGLPDGRRIILMAQDRLRVGRDRHKENDFLLRWVPMTTGNNQLSQEISAEHFQLELSAKGLLIEDLGSRNGTMLDGVALEPKAPRLIENAPAGAEITVAATFRLRLRAYQTPEADGQNVPPPDRVHCDALGVSTVPPLWHRANKARIEAVRLERRSNLSHEEYVLLFRQLVLGSGAHCPIRLPADDGVASVARVFFAGGHFWLERLTDQAPVAIGDHELGRRELAPLSEGQAIQLGSTRLAIHEAEQDLSREA